MKNICICVFLQFFALQLVLSQNDSTSLQTFNKGSYVRLGVAFSSLSVSWLNNMQSFLKKSNIETNDGLSYCLPFETGFRLKDWFATLRVDVPFHFSFTDSKNFFFGGSIEKSFVKGRNYRFNLGLGGGTYINSLRIERQERNRSINFNDLFNNTYPTIPYLYNSGGAFDLSVAISHREKRRINFADYIRLGYRRGFKPYIWKAEGINLMDAPKDRMDMVYFHYCISISRNR